jgi:hypothetical protein
MCCIGACLCVGEWTPAGFPEVRESELSIDLMIFRLAIIGIA